MLRFLGNIIDQLDLALEHIAKGNFNDARFGLMLTDNVVEITLHQIATDKLSDLKSFGYMRKEYAHEAALQQALGRRFARKVKFAKLEGKLSEEDAETISTLHAFRNEVYHIGIQHEPILPALSAQYFKLSCDFLGRYEPRYLGWSSDLKLPERASKYFEGKHFMPGSIEEFQSACRTLGEKVEFDPAEAIETLANHLDEVIENQDGYIDLIATGGPRQRSRDQVIIDGQAWSIAFSEDCKKFARDNGCPEMTVFQFVDWIKDNHPLKYRSDPIPSWQERSNSLRREANPNQALKKYRSFIDQTATIRENIEEGAAQVDAYIDGQIEQMRMEAHSTSTSSTRTGHHDS